MLKVVLMKILNMSEKSGQSTVNNSRRSLLSKKGKTLNKSFRVGKKLIYISDISVQDATVINRQSFLISFKQKVSSTDPEKINLLCLLAA